MGRLLTGALRVVLVVVSAGAVAIQAGLAWTLVSGADPEDGSMRLSALRIATIVGMVSVEVAAVSVWRLTTMVRDSTLVTGAALRLVDVLIGSIVAAAFVWFAVTALNAPGQRDDPGVSAIMAGIGVGILGVALVVRLLRELLARAVAAG